MLDYSFYSKTFNYIDNRFKEVIDEQTYISLQIYILFTHITKNCMSSFIQFSHFITPIKSYLPTVNLFFFNVHLVLVQIHNIFILKMMWRIYLDCNKKKVSNNNNLFSCIFWIYSLHLFEILIKEKRNFIDE